MDGDLAQRYRDFAGYARPDSPCLTAWAEAVAADPEVLAWLAGLPRREQQPNLVFAAARWNGASAPAPYAELRRVLAERPDAVLATMRARSTQTNEVGRLATLLPALSLIPGPVALIELGASAGLTLHPDRYDYAWPPVGSLRGSGGPVLTARVQGAMPVPAAHPEVTWRGGCDLAPVDPGDPDAVAWLRTLVWPEQRERLARLDTALAVARRHPVPLVRGDLADALPGLLAEAGRHGTPVVYHSAVIAYLEPPERERFAASMAERVRAGECRWISNEAPTVLPRIAATAGGRAAVPGRFVLALDGRALAHTHGHGAGLGWL